MLIFFSCMMGIFVYLKSCNLGHQQGHDLLKCCNFGIISGFTVPAYQSFSWRTSDTMPGFTSFHCLCKRINLEFFLSHCTFKSVTSFMGKFIFVLISLAGFVLWISMGALGMHFSPKEKYTKIIFE